MKKSYEEMCKQHAQLCRECHSCGDCVYNRENGTGRGGCFSRWMYDVLVDGRDEDLPLDEEF
jgi:hypothetical protein